MELEYEKIRTDSEFATVVLEAGEVLQSTDAGTVLMLRRHGPAMELPRSSPARTQVHERPGSKGGLTPEHCDPDRGETGEAGFCEQDSKGGQSAQRRGSDHRLRQEDVHVDGRTVRANDFQPVGIAPK